MVLTKKQINAVKEDKNPVRYGWKSLILKQDKEIKRLKQIIKDFESFLYFEGYNPKEVFD